MLGVGCCREFIGSTNSTCVELHFPYHLHRLAWGVGVGGGYLIYGIFLNLSLGGIISVKGVSLGDCGGVFIWFPNSIVFV